MTFNKVLYGFLFLTLSVYSFKAQNLTKEQTIDYIFTNSNYKTRIDAEGNIIIDDKVKFMYKNIVLNKSNDSEIEFRCRLENGNCINSKESGRDVFSYKIKIDKDKQINIYNAFDYLINLLAHEKPELTKDPFAAHNYKLQKSK